MNQSVYPILNISSKCYEIILLLRILHAEVCIHLAFMQIYPPKLKFNDHYILGLKINVKLQRSLVSTQTRSIVCQLTSAGCHCYCGWLDLHYFLDYVLLPTGIK